MRWIKLSILTLVLLPLFISAVGFAFLWRSLPQTSGTLAIPGLEASVTVTRDKFGVPTIRAENRHDLYLALGFVHAQDRLFQMDLQRRLAEGRLSEILGPQALPTDRTMRTLGLYRHAANSRASVPPDFAAVLDAYASGVNAFLESAPHLPVEFTLLNYYPERWQAADSLAFGKLFALQLTGNYQRELMRAALAQKLTAQQIEELYPDYPSDGPIALDNLASLTRGLPLEKMLASLPSVVGPTIASNEWVVDGAHSETGKPLLANDPHLDYGAPLIWYLVRLASPDISVTGATVAGAPVVVLGHNDRIAWGYTTTIADVEDVFVEKLDPTDPSRYQTPDGMQAFETLKEEIPVKGQAPELFTIRQTRHGPVISDLVGSAANPPVAGTIMALQTSFLTDDDRSVEAQWRLGLAGDWASWVDALRTFTAPPLNMVYADQTGNIGFFVPGHIPVRKSGNGLAPVPGWTGDFDWDGWIPFEKLPQAENPASGHLASANNKITPADYPYLVSLDWDAPFRIERIEQGLAATPVQSIESSARLQGDIVSLAARRLLPLMLEGGSADDRASAVMQMLAKWDCRMSAARPEPLIFMAWLRAFNRRLYQPLLGELFDRYWDPRPIATEGILTKHRQWCGSDGCAAILQAGLKDALDELSSTYGTDPTEWRWGAAHQALFAHPLLHRIVGRIPLLRDLFDRQVPASGSFDTINAGDFRYANPDGPFTDIHGPGLRAIYDLSNLDNSIFVTALGQSANPLSEHYADMLPRWQAFEWIHLPPAPQGEMLTLRPR